METNEKQKIGSRVNELIFRLDKNQSSFAKSIGFTHAAVYSTVHGKSKPRYEFVESILKAYPQVSRDWLMEGKGEMFLADQSKEVPTPSSNYLMETLARIEETFKSTLDENRRVIEDQRFIIDTLKNQVAALTSVNGGFIDPNTGEPKMFILENYVEALVRA